MHGQLLYSRDTLSADSCVVVVLVKFMCRLCSFDISKLLMFCYVQREVGVTNSIAKQKQTKLISLA